MKLALTQTAMNQFAKLPGGEAELRKRRAEAIKLRDETVRDHDQRIAELEGLIERMGIALGEIGA